jgi:hypothetical protein
MLLDTDLKEPGVRRSSHRYCAQSVKVHLARVNKCCDRISLCEGKLAEAA